MKNQGKIFEQDFRASIDLSNQDLFYYRFKDGTAGWGGPQNSFVRFQSNNVCDAMIFYKGNLFLIELKRHTREVITFFLHQKKPI